MNTWKLFAIFIAWDNLSCNRAGCWFFWLSVWYSSSVAVTIRRPADKDKGSISFNTLLEETKTNPTVISRTRFNQLFVDGNYHEYVADADFDRYVGLGKENI